MWIDMAFEYWYPLPVPFRLGPLRTRNSLATQATKVAGSGPLSESQYVMKPKRGSVAVNRVTTFDDGDVIGWEPTH